MSDNPKKKPGLPGKLFRAVGRAGGAVGNVAGLLFTTAGHAAGTTGRRATLKFAATSEGEVIPPATCQELAQSLALWLGEGRWGDTKVEAPTVELEESGSVVRLVEPGILGRTFRFLFAPEPDAGQVAEAVVVLRWPFDRLELDHSRPVFVWHDGVRLGPRTMAADYISLWLIARLGFKFVARDLIDKPARPPSGLFVGRRDELSAVGAALNAYKRQGPWLFSVVGHGGAGKSYFLKQLRERYDARVLWAQVDHQNVETGHGVVSGLAGVIHSLALKFQAAGCPTPAFDKVYAGMVRTSAGEGASPGGLGGYLRKGVEAASGLNPVLAAAGAGLQFYDSMSKELQEESDALATNSWIQKLTAALVTDLKVFVTRQRSQYYLWRRPVLVFDTYEWIAPLVDTWLRTCLLGNRDFRGLDPVVLVAGRYDLVRINTRWSEFQHDLQKVRLEAFDESETRTYLEALGVDGERAEAFAALTGGSPLFLSLASASDSEDAAVKALGDRILEEVEPERRQLILDLAVPEGFNRDLVARLVDDPEAARAAFDRATRLTFVEAAGGRWVYAPGVRDVLLRYYALESPEGLEATKKRL